jgi:hypothetical protein
VEIFIPTLPGELGFTEATSNAGVGVWPKAAPARKAAAMNGIARLFIADLLRLH